MIRTLFAGAALAVAVGSSFATPALAAPVFWTDWIGSSATAGFTATGTITTTTSSVDVTYNNPLGVGFYQTGASGEPDYWTDNSSARNNATSPYTNATVDNIPTGTDVIALQYAGTQSLSFSEAIANPVFAFSSLNGNGYAFDQDFDVLSVGDGSAADACGFFGCGTVTKEVVDLGGGTFEYQLIGTGEPHGTIRFTGAFSTVSWRSLTDEYWNGFTVGVQGTAVEVFTPEPASLAILLAGVSGLVVARRRRAHR